MSSIEKIFACLMLIGVCMGFDVMGRRIKTLEGKFSRWERSEHDKLKADLRTHKVAAPPSCSRSKFCPCTPPCMCTECRCGGVLPKPGTPLLTAVVHDGQARIAWLDENGQRQERTMTEEEFVQLNKGE